MENVEGRKIIGVMKKYVADMFYEDIANRTINISAIITEDEFKSLELGYDPVYFIDHLFLHDITTSDSDIVTVIQYSPYKKV